MGVAFKIVVKDFEGLWCERSSSLAFFRRFAANEFGEILHSVLVPFFRFRHPSFEHRLDLLGTLRRDVQLFKPIQPVVLIILLYYT